MYIMYLQEVAIILYLIFIYIMYIYIQYNIYMYNIKEIKTFNRIFSIFFLL